MAPGSDASISPPTGFGIAVLAVNTNAIFIRWSAVPGLVKIFYRALFTVTLLAPVALARHRDVLATILGRDLLATEGAGVALAAHLASWFESLNHTTAAASVTLAQSQPLLVAVGTWAILDECMSRRTVVDIGAVLVGITFTSVSGFFTAGDAPRPLFENRLAVVGAVTAAAYVLTGRSVRSEVSLVPHIVVIYSVCTVALLIVTVGRGNPLTGHLSREWLLFLGIVAGPGVFGHAVINWALAHLESSVVFVSLPGEPVGSMIFVLSLLGKIPALPTVLGGVVVFDGIYVSAS